MSSLPEEAVLWFAICFFCFFCFLIGWQHAAVPHPVVRDDDQPAQPHAVRRELGRRRDRRADGLDGVPADRAAVLRRRGARQHARAAQRDARGSWRPACPRPTTRRRARWRCWACCCRSRSSTGSTTSTNRGADLERRDARSTTSCTRSGSSPGWACRSASTSRIVVTKLLTIGTLVVEAAVPFLVLTPVLWRVDTAAGAGAAGRAARQHRGDGEPRDLLGGDDRLRPVPARHRALAAVRPAGAAASGRARVVFYDVDCGVCFFIARVLARLDVLRRLRWSRTATGRRCRADVDTDAARQDDPGGRSATTPARRWTRARRVSRRSSRALPFGRLWAWPLRLPGLSAAGERRLRRRSRATGRASRPGSGWRRVACRAPRPRALRRARSRRRRCGRGCGRTLPLVRELGIALVFVILAAEVSVANPSVPRWRCASTTAPSGWWRRSCTRTSSRAGRCSRPRRRCPTRPSSSTP